MARKNERWENHQALTLQVNDPTVDHTCNPIPTRTGHVCMTCGRPVKDVNNPDVVRAKRQWTPRTKD